MANLLAVGPLLGLFRQYHFAFSVLLTRTICAQNLSRMPTKQLLLTELVSKWLDI